MDQLICQSCGTTYPVEDAIEVIDRGWQCSNPQCAKPEQGIKYDDKKIRMDLIPPELLWAVGDILTFGAEKYGDRNWEHGMDWGRVYGALQRHLNAWWGGGAVDSETGKSHLWHAGCCLAFLIAYEQRGVGHDSRSAPSALSPEAFEKAMKR